MAHSWDAVFSMAAFMAAPLAEAKTIMSVTLLFQHANETLDHPDFFGAIPMYALRVNTQSATLVMSANALDALFRKRF